MQHTTILTFLGTPHFHAVCLILVSAAAIEALIAIWAATSRIHWFWRAFTVWTGIAILLPIRAFQPALVFTITSPLTIALISVIRHRARPSVDQAAGANQPPPTIFRFAISDLLLAMAIFGLFLALLINLVPRLGELHVAEFTLTIIAQTAIPVLAWASIATPRLRTCRIGLLLVVVAIALAVQFITPRVFSDWALVGILFESRWRFHDTQVVAIALGELSLILLAAIGLARRQRSQEASSASHRAARRALFIVATLWVLSLGLVYWHMLWLMPLPPPFSTEPTHYPRLMEISGRMWLIEKAGFPTGSELERQTLIAETIPLSETANFIPYDLPNETNWAAWNMNYIGPGQHVRSFARAIDAEAGAALARGDKERACTLALTNVRLGLMLQRGGTVIEYLIGIALQSIANYRLIEIRRDLPPDQARRLIAAWQRALAEQEPIDAIINRDRAIAERAYGWAARLANIVDWAGLPELYSSINEAQLRRETTARLLQTDLAIRLYQQEHDGALPDRLDPLVPAYLPHLPIDAYSKQPLIYRPIANGFILYSVGHDQTDNGGKLSNMQTYYSRDDFENLTRGYDYDLDTTTRP